MLDLPTSVHCLSSTTTAASPVAGFEPVTMTSRRFDESGSLELDEDALVAEVSHLQDVGHSGERVTPRRDLGGCRPIPELVEEPIRKQVGEASLAPHPR